MIIIVCKGMSKLVEYGRQKIQIELKEECLYIKPDIVISMILNQHEDFMHPGENDIAFWNHKLLNQIGDHAINLLSPRDETIH